MKIKLLGLICATTVCVMAGCDKEDIQISAGDVNSQNIIVYEDGTMQTSLISTFDKEYYKIDDLKKFMSDSLQTFNDKNKTAVKLNSTEKNGTNAVAVFDFSNPSEFGTFYGEYTENQGTTVSTQLLSASDAKSNSIVPDDLNKYGKSKTKEKGKALKDKYKVFVIDNTKGALTGTTDITVDGDIKFSHNVEKQDDNTARITDLKDVAVIVFNP